MSPQADDSSALLQRARSGDSRAFDELIATYRSELRAHCYRMLGSVHDADDALQDAVFRAWKALPGFTERGTVRAWLYSIATNTALDVATHRSRRELPVYLGPASGPDADLEPAYADIPWLEPYPDQWLATDPDARFEQRESVELAFLIALQQLPPLQRAVLLLREVIGYSAAEIAAQLGTSTASVNSALQRARATVRAQRPEATQQQTLSALGEQKTRALAQQYADAMERADVDAIISMLTDDATWSMPPIPNYFRGHAAVASFLRRFPLTKSWMHRPTTVNGQLAIGCYMYDPTQRAYLPHCLDVLTLRDDRISAVTAFLGTDFPRFGLPVNVG
jgi:RNA polymerase sigma-70 factor (ECF subfamily)